MAKLTKLRSALKKMNSFGKNNSNSNSNNKKAALNRADSGASSSSSGAGCYESDHNDKRLQRVYVGRSRKEYLVPAELLDHPVVRELVVVCTHQSDTETTTTSSITITIGCEAVLFDHLLWMLEDVDNPAAAGSGPQIQPFDIDLARFYAY